MILKSLLQIRRNIGQTYNKVRVTRLPGQETILMLRADSTVEQLYQHIQYNFPNPKAELLVAPNFTTNLKQIVVTDEVRKENESVKEQPILPLLMANNFFLYEIHNSKAEILYGVELLEFNYINNRNLPEGVQRGLIQLFNEWETGSAVSEILQLPPSPPSEQKKEQIQEVYDIIGKSFANLQAINNLKAQRPLDSFINKMSVLMGTNWVFLYVITFGYYGWDVGEPLAYLSAVGVDLFALLKWYNLDQRVEEEVMIQEGKQIGLLNLAAQKRWQRWNLCFSRRQAE